MKKQRFLAAMYLRLSRDDHDVSDVTGKAFHGGVMKSESNSIANQRELIRAFLNNQPDIELYDIYVDDGYSGSNFDRPDLKRMMSDIEAGRVNCVIVKDLSRFGRDYIESGRYIQRVFPDSGVRFIAVTDHYDSFYADEGDRGIVLPVKNFINDSYCRDISAKVKSQFQVKRRKGECIAPFAPYGYRKAEDNKNQLIIDEYAAEIVRKIFEWKIDGMAVSAIAEKLNGLGILSPREYKKCSGSHYKGGFSGALKSMWSSSTVKRILTNEIYLGHLVQGKTEKINYKIKKCVEKPKEEWIKVENTHEAIITQDCFRSVQNLWKADSRVSPVTGESSLFAGILFCGDCGEQMIRRVNSYGNTKKECFICSTKNRGEGCTRHCIGEEKLRELVTEVVRTYANSFLDEKKVTEKSLRLEQGVMSAGRDGKEITELRKEQDKYKFLCRALYEDLRQEVITEEEFARLSHEFKCRLKGFKDALEKQEAMAKELSGKRETSAGCLKMMRECPIVREIDRHTLCSMVKEIRIFENHRMEIELFYTDPYRISEAEKGFREKNEISGIVS